MPRIFTTPAGRAAPVFALAALLLGGCTTYQFRVLQPPAAAGTLAGYDEFAVVTVDPLTYKLRAKDNRLIVLIENPTDGPIQLLGDRSAVVDPDGQSHPLAGQTIAAGSFGKLILPPPEPRGYGPGYYGPGLHGPGLGIGLGTTIGRGPTPPGLVQPAYFADGGGHGETFAVIDRGNNYYWDWKGETVSRLALVYRRGVSDGGAVFTQSFVIARVAKK